MSLAAYASETNKIFCKLGGEPWTQSIVPPKVFWHEDVQDNLINCASLPLLKRIANWQEYTELNIWKNVFSLEQYVLKGRQWRCKLSRGNITSSPD